jgi:hypothetical protein
MPRPRACSAAQPMLRLCHCTPEYAPLLNAKMSAPCTHWVRAVAVELLHYATAPPGEAATGGDRDHVALQRVPGQPHGPVPGNASCSGRLMRSSARSTLRTDRTRGDHAAPAATRRILADHSVSSWTSAGMPVARCARPTGMRRVGDVCIAPADRPVRVVQITCGANGISSFGPPPPAPPRGR